MIQPDEYRVVMMPFPGDILACVRLGPDGFPTVYINDYLCPAAKRAALDHELAHLSNDDFYNHWTIFDAEKRACHTLRLSSMPRAFTPLSESDTLRLDRVGLALTLDAFGPFPCAEPLDLPSPVFSRTPEPPINIGKKVW